MHISMALGRDHIDDVNTALSRRLGRSAADRRHSEPWFPVHLRFLGDLPQIPFQLRFGTGNKLRGLHVERLREAEQNGKRWSSLSALEKARIGLVALRAKSEALLANPAFATC